jgi:uncharacterized protein (DUF433 family)
MEKSVNVYFMFNLYTKQIKSKIYCGTDKRVIILPICVRICAELYLTNKIISRNKEILGGTPVFKRTCVPVKALWDYLKAGNTVEDFLEDFPSVERDQAIALIERAQ